MANDAKKGWSDPELLLDQWYKYEQIAMHFNDLILRFRTQALGGLTAIGTLAAVFVSAKGVAASFLPLFFAALFILWFAAWILDSRYYSQLLYGAVTKLRELEKRSAVGDIQHINLSTGIDEATTNKWVNNVHAFYFIIGTALILLCILTALVERQSAAAAPTSVPIPVTFTVDAYPSDGGLRVTPGR